MTLREQINTLGKNGTPFLFCIDYKAKNGFAYPLDKIPHEISYSFDKNIQHTIYKVPAITDKNPITKETLLNNSTEFVAGKRIYYIFISTKPLNTQEVRIRVYKRDSKVFNQITKMVFSNDFRLSQDQIYYYQDYIVISNGGEYCMAVYAKNDLERPKAIADFKVKN